MIISKRSREADIPHELEIFYEGSNVILKLIPSVRYSDFQHSFQNQHHSFTEDLQPPEIAGHEDFFLTRKTFKILDVFSNEIGYFILVQEQTFLFVYMIHPR